MEKIYKLKNKNKKLSRLVSSHSYTGVYKEMLIWLAEYNISPSVSCIELGCENGLFTQCLQLAFPSSKVAGLDSLKAPILMAKSLSYDNNLSNISFYQKDLTKSFVLDGSFDVIFAPFVFHELMGSNDNEWSTIISNLETLASSSATLIAFSRFPYAHMSEELIKRFEGSSFKLKELTKLKSGDETFPIHIFERSIV